MSYPNQVEKKQKQLLAQIDKVFQLLLTGKKSAGVIFGVNDIK